MNILIKPIVTEKVNAQAEKGVFGFVVNKKANKVEIKKAIEKAYSVKVASVNTMVYAGKLKTRHTKAGVVTGRTTAYKKAIVTVANGEVIDFYSGI